LVLAVVQDAALWYKRPGLASVKSFGNESSLFVSLWKQTEPKNAKADDYFGLNKVTPEKMRAIDWIGEGTPRLR
jgi:hypothetical protein